MDTYTATPKDALCAVYRELAGTDKLSLRTMKMIQSALISLLVGNAIDDVSHLSTNTTEGTQDPSSQ